MASMVVAAGGLVFLVLRQGLGPGTQLGTPDTQYVVAGGTLLGVFAALLHFEPLIRRWPLARVAETPLRRTAAVLAAFVWGGAVVLTAYILGLHGRIYQHLGEKLPWLPVVLVLLSAGVRLGHVYVEPFAPSVRRNRAWWRRVVSRLRPGS